MKTEKIYSKSNPGTVLAVVTDSLAAHEGRVDLSQDEQPLQASVIPLPKGKLVAPHIHESRKPADGHRITQEGWVVMRGKLHVKVFDFDKTFLYENELLPGFVMVTYDGGHSLQCMDDETVILEFKNGPYLGRDFETFDHSSD